MSDNLSLGSLPKIKTQNSRRVGRGIGSSKGKTSGKGVKGQKARSGVAIKGFEGGQTPVHMRLPKRGFKNVLRQEYEAVSIDSVAKALEGKSDAPKELTKVELKNLGLIRNAESKVKLIGGKGKAPAIKVKIAVDSYSEKTKSFA